MRCQPSLIALTLALGMWPVAACRAPSPARQYTTVVRPAGEWHGSGNQTIGLVSDTGQFRITWETRGGHGSGSGHFKITVHSAVSGRPLQVVADQQGPGGGTTNFADDPRPYNLMVEASDLEWSVSVDEVVVTEKAGR